ncbi:MAG: glucokinase [Leptolyngbyaceae cyanobacterium]
MTELLAGDIGGTKTILRLATVTDGQLQTQFEHKYVSAEFAGLVPMVQQFVAMASEQLGQALQPERACFAIAGPVINNTSQLTNLPWNLQGDRLREELSLTEATLINDFEAIGYGVLGLEPNDLHTLQTGKPDDTAPIAVIGAGTGLGQGYLMHQGDRYRVFPSEGGHADFAPRSEQEFQLLKYLRDKHQITRVSAERVVSGQGIISIYQYLRNRAVAKESPEIAEVVTTWERQAGMTKTVDPAAAISQAAQAQTDNLSQQTLDLFVGAYGAEAGNLALKLLPYGGLYVAGGIAAKNLDLIAGGAFMNAFGDKGRVSDLLREVPVHIVLNPQVGLIGAARYAAGL